MQFRKAAKAIGVLLALVLTTFVAVLAVEIIEFIPDNLAFLVLPVGLIVAAYAAYSVLTRDRADDDAAQAAT